MEELLVGGAVREHKLLERGAVEQRGAVRLVCLAVRHFSMSLDGTAYKKPTDGFPGRPRVAPLSETIIS
jgi:hypothetical protein